MEYLIVTDYLVPSKSDVSDELQKIIDDNPNRTIFFPDGDYYISKPLITPADPKFSVSLKLSGYARIAATENWSGEGALIKLGGKMPANDIRTCGSNYFFEGGILDGAGKTDGISIDGGRETSIRNVSVKHTKIGIHIKHGANNGSSDADIFGVNIVGNREDDSVGILAEGWDNTFTNIRIADVNTGVWLKSSGNILRNVHPLYTLDFKNFENSRGFINDKERPNNWFDFCYSDNFSVGFLLNARAVLQNCFCFWYSPRGKERTAIKTDGKFDSTVTNLTVGFCGEKTENAVLRIAESGGNGTLQNLFADGDYTV